MKYLKYNPNDDGIYSTSQYSVNITKDGYLDCIVNVNKNTNNLIL